MEAIIILSGIVAAIVLGIAVLAFIGLKETKRREKAINDYNAKSIKSFMNGQKNKKFQRASTPKVPKIK